MKVTGSSIEQLEKGKPRGKGMMLADEMWDGFDK